jgi:hypothetical protein
MLSVWEMQRAVFTLPRRKIDFVLAKWKTERINGSKSL